MNRSTQILRWLPAVLWMALIGCFSTDPFSGTWSETWLKSCAAWLRLPVTAHGLQIANLVLRKSAHLGEFFVLGVLLHRALAGLRDKSGAVVFGWVVLAGALYAVSSELLQTFTVAREPSPLDTALNLAGVLCSQWTLGHIGIRPKPWPSPSPP